jgi:hypothetical protein
VINAKPKSGHLDKGTYNKSASGDEKIGGCGGEDAVLIRRYPAIFREDDGTD